MPRFSDDDVIDLCVAEGVVRAGQEAEREQSEAAAAARAQKQRTEGHREKAEELGLV